MNFIGEIDGEPVTLNLRSDGLISIRCDLIDGEYATEQECEAAIKRKKLQLRKQFSNPSAWMKRWSFGRDNDITEVTVTSMDAEDYAWVTYKGKRSKERRDTLFASKDALVNATVYEKEQLEKIQSNWKSVPRWEPLP